MEKDASQNKRKWGFGFGFALGLIAGVLLTILLISWTTFGACHHHYSESKTAETWARTIRAAVQNWQSSQNSVACPTIEQLISEKHLDTGTTKVDPWGNPFELTCTDDEIFVTSAGPDRKRRTSDDIQIPKHVTSTQ
ncbi:MAG TPA: hypothetical protein VKP30_29550 [Polyangiaceae bacterium]|nr:hypothetical protein [Polyangiaceae bacterium]